MTYRAIETQWDSYAQAALPAGAPSELRTHLRRAFYSGATAALHELAAFSGEADAEVGTARAAALRDELWAFAHNVGEGLA